MRLLALSGIVVGALLSMAAPAAADCAVPVWVGTATGTHVPVQGVVYVHHEMMMMSDELAPFLKLRWLDGEGTARVIRVEENVVAVEYAGPAGARLQIGGRYDESLAELELDDHWTAPAAAPRVLQYWHHQTSWACSSANTLMVQLDQAVAAVRVRVHVNGHAVDYIEAPVTDESKTVLELGKIDCGVENMPLEQLQAGVELELFAIRLDGSEVRITAPFHVAFDEMPGHEGGMSHAFTIVATQDVGAVSAPVVMPPKPGRGLGVLVLVLAGLGFTGSLLLLRRVATAANDCSPAS